MCLPSILRTLVQNEWNVPVIGMLPFVRVAILSFISLAALLVKVRRRAFSGLIKLWLRK